jgi:hypothetical protein
MIEIERSPGQGVRIGACLLRVLAVRAGEVVVALLDPNADCHSCGEPTSDRRRCPLCAAEALVCPACEPSWRCSCGAAT